MPIGWFFCGYQRRSSALTARPTRYCTMDDFTASIDADGGQWTETEVLGDTAIVKVRASVETLTTIAATAGFQRIPLTFLDESLGSLTAGQRTTLRTRVEAMGYTLTEIQSALGTDLSIVTLRQLLRFVTSRRRKARYDGPTDTIICDGPEYGCRSIESVDAEVA